MSTESSSNFNKGSKITLLYEGVENDSIISTTGYIKNVDSQNIVLHNRLKDVSINFNVETKSGKKLYRQNNEISKINVKSFREWKYDNEVHIVLPSVNEITDDDNKHPIVVTGSREERHKIDFKDILFNVNGHKVGVVSQKGGSEWMIISIEPSKDNDDKILDCGFNNVKSEYDVIHIATKFNIGVFSFNELDRSKFTH